jgi:hypothetical protein
MKIMVFLWIFFSKITFASEISFSSGNYVVQKILQEMGEGSTTSLRSEDKTVVANHDLERIFSSFNHNSSNIGVDVSSRDKESLFGKNVTFTFYGKKLFFYNLGIKTTVKFRMRFYLLSNPDSSGFERVDPSGFLEIKIKNPSAFYRGVSLKKRIKLSDEDLIKFCNVRYDDLRYEEKLLLLQNELIGKDKSKESKVCNFLNLVSFLSNLDADFTRFDFATSYERASLKIKELKYKKKRKFWRKNLGEVEYQVTTDRKIRSYLIDIDFTDNFNFTNYFSSIGGDERQGYPDDAVVVEVKTPVIVDYLEEKEISKSHKYLKEVLFFPILDKSLVYEGFKKGKGKFYHLNCK